MSNKRRNRRAWTRLQRDGTLTPTQVARARRLGLSPLELPSDPGAFIERLHVERFGRPVFERLAELGVELEIERQSYSTEPLDVVAHLAHVGAELVALVTLDRVDRDVLDAAAADLRRLVLELEGGHPVQPRPYVQLDVCRRWSVPPDPPDPWYDDGSEDGQQPRLPTECTIVTADGELLEPDAPL